MGGTIWGDATEQSMPASMDPLNRESTKHLTDGLDLKDPALMQPVLIWPRGGDETEKTKLQFQRDQALRSDSRIALDQQLFMLSKLQDSTTYLFLKDTMNQDLLNVQMRESRSVRENGKPTLSDEVMSHSLVQNRT